MTQSLIRQLTASLNKLRGNSAGSLERLRDVLISLENGGQGRALINRRSFVDGIVSAHDRIERIESALARMRDGSYGFCSGCGAAIPEHRLRAQPWTASCSQCLEIQQASFGGMPVAFQRDTARFA